MQWFSFKGIESASLDVEAVDYVVELLPQDKSRYITVPGRNGSILAKDDSLGDTIIKVNCVFPVTSQESLRITARRIATWLRGNGKLIFWDEPDKYREARVYNAPKLYDKGGWGQFEVEFRCDPVSKAVENTVIELNTECEIGGSYENRGIITATVPLSKWASEVHAGIDGDYLLKIVYDFTGGEEIIIDLINRDVFISQRLRNECLTPRSEFFACPPGTHTVNIGMQTQAGFQAFDGSYKYNASWL